jgi:phage tail sheath protein FI
MPNHGVFVQEKSTSISTPVVAQVGIPFVIGAAPIQSADTPAEIGKPVLCTDWNEAVSKLGYSDDWESYTLCEFMYSQFKLYGMSPVIFCNLLDPAQMKQAVAAADKAVTDHKIALPLGAVNDATLVVKPAGGTGGAYAKDEDYSVYHEGENCVVELIDGGAAYDAAQLSVAYTAVTPNAVTDNVVAAGLEAIEYCLTKVGIIPDLIVAPGHSGNSVVAAVMATKAAAISGLFRAKALIDIPTDVAPAYDTVRAAKQSLNVNDVNQVACWPMLTLGDKRFHLSTQLAGLIATVDNAKNNGCPYESPSNKSLKCDGMTTAAGTAIDITLAQANILNGFGVTTAIGMTGGWVAWGNYTACYPANTDVKDYFTCVSRMFDWVGNTVIRTFWTYCDNPMNARLRDSILDTCNIWLNGLYGAGYVLGARAEILASENPLTDLMAGIIRFHIWLTPPSPAQEADFILEYNAGFLETALTA